jgi:CD2 antigen cytoplasmic tail-binding protein 2
LYFRSLGLHFDLVFVLHIRTIFFSIEIYVLSCHTLLALMSCLQGGEDRTEDGIEIEPFNLNQEREEGYFDAEGNYVEYRNDDEHKDAWFESTEVDKRFAGKLKEKEKAEEEDAELTTEEIWRIKRRISDALLPEETV